MTLPLTQRGLGWYYINGTLAKGVSVMPVVLKDELREWVNRNPLRVWRREQGLSMRDVASLMGVSLASVESWEYGNAIPNDVNMSLLMRLTNIPDLPVQWNSWYREAPSGGNE